jgi:hypothetical protein
MTTPDLEQAVLVGGTGRSGTTIAGRVLNNHPALALTSPAEVRFLTGREGILEALGPLLPGGKLGDSDPEKFARRMRGLFYRWSKPSGAEEGLHRSVDEAILDAAVTNYLEEVSADPVGASRRLIFAIIPSTLRSSAGSRWVDTTPSNVQSVRALHALLPEAKFVHMMRDGRDVAVSFASKRFGPGDPLEALEKWGERMLRSFAEESAVPAGMVIRVDLADWVGPDGIDSLRTVCDFLGADRNAGLENWFSANVTSDAMHGGRWRRDLTTETAEALDHRYRNWCDLLTERYPQFPLPRAT